MEAEHGIKMAETDNAAGGFTALNTGTIKDCYCIFIKKKKNAPGCFAAKNRGDVKNSFSAGNDGTFEHWDKNGTVRNSRIKSRADAQALGYDLKNIWSYDEKDNSLSFREENWKRETDFSPERKKFLIKSKDEFLLFADLVNKGDNRVTNALVRLECDIDLGGKSINPIGTTRENSFKGIFDGNRHSVKNFRIKKKEISSLGLFGVLIGTVQNLIIDCEVSGEGNIGGFCGINEGNIYCCGAVSNVNGTGDKLRLGGFCGQNLGNIRMCYSAVSLSVRAVPVLPVVLAAASAFLLGTIAFLLIPASGIASRPYATEEPDRNQIRIPKEERTTPLEQGMHSLEFRFNETLHIDSSNGYCYLNFENPSYATNMIVVTLESDDGSKTVMARSGAVTPGHRLDYLTLTDAGYDLINSGTSTGNIVLTGYDSETSDKAMVDSVLPVHIVID